MMQRPVIGLATASALTKVGRSNGTCIHSCHQDETDEELPSKCLACRHTIHVSALEQKYKAQVLTILYKKMMGTLTS